MKIATVFFDLGNTLLYSDVPSPERVQAACKVMANEFAGRGYPVSPEEFAAKHFENLLKYYDIREQENIEQGAESVFRQTLADFGFTGVPEKDIAAFLASFYRTTQGNWHLDEDAIPTLEKIITQQRRIGLITNAGYAEDIRQLLRKNKLEPYFSSVVISAEVGFRKPHPEIFQIALRQMGSAPEQSVMVGDSLLADIYGASRCGLRTVWFRKYTGDPPDFSRFCHPDHELFSLRELPEILEKSQTQPD